MNTLIPVLSIMGMALIYTLLFVFFGYFTNRGVENALLRRSSIHGHSSVFVKCYNGLSRIFKKEESIPRQGHRVLFVLAPIFSFSVALSLWTNTIKNPSVQVYAGSILTVYILLLLLTLSLVTVAWASNSKYPILASFRLLKVLVPVEIALLFLFFSIAVHFNTFEINTIVVGQGESIIDWGIVKQPLIAITFLFLIMVKSIRAPFDYILNANDLAGGVIAEYSVMGKSLVRGALHLSYLFCHLFFVVIFLGADKVPFDLLPPNKTSLIVGEVQSGAVLLTKFILVLGLTRIIRLGFPSINFERVSRVISYWVVPIMLLNMLLTVALTRIM